jgi:outer membrane receptor for ferrienterochelin and colicins
LSARASSTIVLRLKNQVTVGQVQDTLNLGADHTLRASLEYRHNTMETFTGDSHVFYDVVSPSGMWDWKITPALSLTNALRLDHLTLGRDGPTPPGFPLNDSYWNRALTEPSFNSGLVWRADDLDTFRLTAARGVQVPSLAAWGGFNGRFGPFFVSGLPTLNPTIVMNYELSWDRAVRSLGGQARLNLYHESYDAVSTFASTVTVVNGVPVFTGDNIGNSDATGIELSFKGKFLDDWRWGVSYTPEIVTDHFDADQPLAATGMNFQHTTPTSTVKANLGWAHGPWEIDGYLQYKSSFYGIVPAGALLGGKLARIDDYVSLDARVAYKLTDWATLSLSAQNFSQSSQRQTAGANVERRVFGTIAVNF